MKSSLAPEIATFVRVIELGTFAAVADEADVTSSGVSRMISRLEDHLGVSLLHRTTRRLTLTAEGEVFLKAAQEMLVTLDQAEAAVSQSLVNPRGHIRVNCGTAFAHHILAHSLAGWRQAYPEISLELSVTDRRIDPIAERFDVTVRVGALENSDILARRIGTVARIIAASPDYLKRHGRPKVPDDLLHHNCLLLTGFRHQATWPFNDRGRRREIRVNGDLQSDSAETLLHAALSGCGVVRLGDFLGRRALATGKLVALLEDVHLADSQPITALIAPGRQSIPRVRVFVDFLKTLT